MAARRRARAGEPTLALINVVFLLLVFFLIAGTITPPRPGDVTLARVDAQDPPAAPAVLAITAEGRLFRAGVEIDEAALVAQIAPGESLRIMPDRDLGAVELVRLGRMMVRAGASDVWLLGERGQP
jgi:biopolymer transport protein ExbD